jgi:hypothetical protein
MGDHDTSGADRGAGGEDWGAHAVALVEAAVGALGIDPAKARLPSGPGATYVLRRGSAQVLVSVLGASGGGGGDAGAEATLQVVSPVVKLPPAGAREALFEKLLRLNAGEARGASFALLGDEVVLLTTRAARDLDASEVDAALRLIGRLADRFDDALAAEFGAERAR